MHCSLPTQLRHAQRHKHYNPELIKKIQQQNPHLVKAQATRESRQLYNLSNQVMTELNRLTCFIRLHINKQGILYTEHTPEHQIEDLIVSHFMYRFPLFHIILSSKRGTFVGFENTILIYDEPLRKVMKKLEKQRTQNQILADIDVFDDSLWEAFYDSQTIAERRNPKRYLQNLPKRFHTLPSFKHERKRYHNSKELTNYF